MDDNHHPSSSTTTKEEEEDLTHDGNRANANASSCSSVTTSINDHGGDAEPLSVPQLPPLDLNSLPDIVHDAIASYLTMKDLHCMMESSQWLSEAYGGRVKELRLGSAIGSTQGDVDPATRSRVVLSLVSRRPGLTRLALHMDEVMGIPVEAFRRGYFDQQQFMESMISGRVDRTPGPFQALCDALADGLCPKINALMVPYVDDLVPSMGKALQSRMGKGCCGLKSLEIKNHISTSSLLPWLSSGACEAVEKLKLEEMEAKAKEDLSEWLLRSRAPRLESFVLSKMDAALAQALCSPGVAPRLQVLELVSTKDADSIALLSQALGGGAWPHLRQLKIRTSSDVGIQEAMPSLVEAIGVGARELTILKLDRRCLGPQGAVAVAGMLRDGGCPRLEELDLSNSKMDDAAVVELARALEGGAPCNTTLRKLGLSWCDITSMGMRELMESMGRGALPHLECLDLTSNDFKDDGVVVLAEAMSGGSLRFLQELSVGFVDMKQRGAKALFRPFRDHQACPHMKKRTVGSNLISDGGVVHLAKAIEAGALQHLQELGVFGIGMNGEGFKSLVKAIVGQQPNPGCPRLEVLDMRSNMDIGDRGVMYLAKMMKMEGAMQHLRVLDLFKTGMTVNGAIALLHSLREGHVCPALETVKGIDIEVFDLRELRDEMNATRGRVRQIKIKPL